MSVLEAYQDFEAERAAKVHEWGSVVNGPEFWPDRPKEQQVAPRAGEVACAAADQPAEDAEIPFGD